LSIKRFVTFKIKKMIRKMIQKYIRIIQKIFITVALFVFYILGFGVTLIFVTIFRRGLLGAGKREKNTFWKDAEGYENDINDCMRES